MLAKGIKVTYVEVALAEFLVVQLCQGDRTGSGVRVILLECHVGH